MEKIIDIPKETKVDVYNFSSKIINFKCKNKKILLENWNSFLADCMELCTYHNDYSVDEMIGILKFLKPIIIFDENIKEFEKEYNINCGEEIGKILETLYSMREKSLEERYKKNS